MNKADLIQKLNELLINEETAVPIYMKHLKAALFWSGLPQAKQVKIRQYLEQISMESLAHKSQFEELLRKVKDWENV